MAKDKFTPERHSPSKNQVSQYRSRRLCALCRSRVARGRVLPPLSDGDWEFGSRSLIKTRMREQNLSYQDLIDRMERAGIEVNHTATALKNRINRGRFSAILLLQLYWVMELESIEVEDVVGPRAPF